MRKKYLGEEQKHYIDGLKRYESKGIPVYIDGERPEEKDWEKILRFGKTALFTCVIMWEQRTED